jgi:ABC-type dipeptide/oligopeptide/nickel transport system permease subunit
VTYPGPMPRLRRALFACAAVLVIAGLAHTTGTGAPGRTTDAVGITAEGLAPAQPSRLSTPRGTDTEGRVLVLLAGLLGGGATALAVGLLVAAGTDRRYRHTRLWPRVRPALRAPPRRAAVSPA